MQLERLESTFYRGFFYTEHGSNRGSSVDVRMCRNFCRASLTEVFTSDHAETGPERLPSRVGRPDSFGEYFCHPKTLDWWRWKPTMFDGKQSIFADETAHVGILTSTIQSLGGTPSTKCQFNVSGIPLYSLAVSADSVTQRVVWKFPRQSPKFRPDCPSSGACRVRTT